MKFLTLVIPFALGALAVPLDRAESVEITFVKEIDVFNAEGSLITRSFEITLPTEVPEVPVEHRPLAVSAAATNSQAPSASGAPPKESQQPKPQVEGNPLATGWVDPSNPNFANIAVYHHNAHRANHSAELVVYDQILAAAAQDWANKCLLDEVVPKDSGYGMNIAFSSFTDGYNPSQFISGSWYNSELENFPAYGQPNLAVTGPGVDFNSWGHFSQVVWNDTQKIGCGIAKCNNSPWLVHAGCMYYPAGNILGSFDKVHPPKGDPILFPNGQTHF